MEFKNEKQRVVIHFFKNTLKIDDNDLWDFEGTIIDWQELYANLYEELTENNNDEDKN